MLTWLKIEELLETLTEEQLSMDVSLFDKEEEEFYELCAYPMEVWQRDEWEVMIPSIKMDETEFKMTFQQLLNVCKNRQDIQQYSPLLIICRSTMQFYKVTKMKINKHDDVLDKNHPYLVIKGIE